MAAHRAEDSARRYLRQISPSIDCLLDPSRHSELIVLLEWGELRLLSIADFA